MTLGKVVYSALFCFLIIIIGAQCNSNIKPGPEIIDCAKDELPIEFQTNLKRERIFFITDERELQMFNLVQMFDLLDGTIKDVQSEIQGIKFSPLNTYFVYRKDVRKEWTFSLGWFRIDRKLHVYEQPIIQVLDSQTKISVPLEISLTDSLNWSPDGKCLVIISDEKSEMGLYHIANGKYEAWKLPQEAYFYFGGLSPDGRWLAGQCGADRTVCIMKTNGEIVYRSQQYGLGWTPDSQYYLVGEKRTGKISYLDINKNWKEQVLIDPTTCEKYKENKTWGTWWNCKYFSSVGPESWSPDGSRFVGSVSLPDPRYAVVVEFPSGRYHPLSEYLRNPVWSPDGTKLVAAELHEPSSGLYIINPDDGKRLQAIKVTNAEIYPLSWISGE